MEKKNNLPTPYQQTIYKSRYARWLPEQNRRENWDETVDRYINFFRGRVDEQVMSHETFEQLRLAILNLEIMPSMRALMTAGPALDRCNVAAFNPVAGDTQVLTKEYGLINIEELKGQTAHVTTIEGNWAEAKFTCYGKQPVFNVGINCKGSNIAVIQATANHRWIKLNGEVVPTSDLKVGDKIPFAAPIIQTDVNSLDYKLGIQHGLIYGDGSATYSQERTKGYHVRLCGKTSECLKYFEGHPVCYPESANGDPIVMLYSDLAKTHALKDLPQHNETDDYLVGFVRGWLAADGYVTKTSQCGLAVGAEEIAWFKSVATRLGYVIQNVYAYPDETNYGKRNKKLFCLTLDRAALVPEDFLLEYKRNNFKPNVKHFTVSFVTDANEAKEVYCAEVPDTNTFTLYKGIVTGNCSYLPIDHPRAFDEILYILMCGTGVGFSVERQAVNQLPVVNEHFEDSDTTIVVEDSKSGWAKGYRELIQMLYAGRVPKWDLSKLRPAGARLKTFGGRSSGPEPLNDLFVFTVNIFRNAAGRKLRSIECHDLACKIGDVVVVGGVRRSALISLSNLSDERMRDAKSGNWWEKNPQRALANNSVAYTEKPDIGSFMKEWTALYQSGSGERGIFNREASRKQAAKNGRRDPEHEWGINPCSEIILRPYQFCNLTEVIVRADDSEEELKRKVHLATILGTLQSTLTDFKYLRKIWHNNTKEECLLGVSLTGIMDNKLMSNSDCTKCPIDTLIELRQTAIETNKQYAQILGINQSTAITCVKPSGTVSQLTDTASGIHTRHSHYYIRTIRGDKKDPLTTFLIDQGIPYEDCVMKPNDTVVFSFPQKSPEGALVRESLTAIEHLNIWLMYQRFWCEHKPSVTITVKEHEWMEVGAWVYEHFDECSGVSFLPYDGGTYKQAPYQECTKEEYDELLTKMPKEIDWDRLQEFEKEDTTTGTQELSCVAGICEITDLGKK